MKVHVKRLFSLSLFVTLLFSTHFGLMANESLPPEVVQAARQGIKAFADADPHPLSSPLTVGTRPGLMNAQAGYGFQVYTVSPAILMKGSDLSLMVTAADLWRFVVSDGDQPVALLTIARMEDRWTAVSLGGAELAAEISRVIAKWPTRQGYSHRFIRIYQARADLIEISRHGRPAGFVPLTASRTACGIEGEFDPAVILSSAELLEPLQKIVSERIIRNDIER